MVHDLGLVSLFGSLFESHESCKFPGPKNIKISVTSLGSRDAHRVTDKNGGVQGGVLTICATLAF